MWHGGGRLGSCRKPQMSSSARGNLKLKLKPRLKLQLKLQMKLTLELRFDLKFWAHRPLRHPVPAPVLPVLAPGKILLSSSLVAPSKWTFIFLRRRQMAQPKSAKLHNQFAAWQTGDKTDRDRERGRAGEG